MAELLTWKFFYYQSDMNKNIKLTFYIETQIYLKLSKFLDAP